MIRTLILLAFTITSSLHLTEGVYFREVKNNHPYVLMGKDDIYLITNGNSLENSAYSIYKVEETLIKKDDMIFLEVKQAVGKPYQTKFRIPVKDKIVTGNTKCFWVDPDGVKTLLDLKISAGNR
ncbi:MAG TPA: hypothetical protein VNZ86_19240 [Bacteroidia bacterium]|nr:hypothetical protein [Bacteroidia bacterium]